MHSKPILLTVCSVSLFASTTAWAAPINFSNVVFQQDFQSSTDVADFENRTGTPDSGQFTQINDGSIVTDAGNNFLRITRNTTDFENVIRRANNGVGEFDFGLTDQLIKFQYDMRFQNVTSASSIAGAFDLADDKDGFDSSTRRNRLEWERANNTTYRFRNVTETPVASSSAFSTVTLFGNKSGAAVDYVGPDGVTRTLNNNSRHYWLDDELEIITGVGSDGFEQFRIWQQADGSVDFDNFVVSTIPEPASLALMGLGGLLVLTGGRRRAGLDR